MSAVCFPRLPTPLNTQRRSASSSKPAFTLSLPWPLVAAFGLPGHLYPRMHSPEHPCCLSLTTATPATPPRWAGHDLVPQWSVLICSLSGELGPGKLLWRPEGWKLGQESELRQTRAGKCWP
ncbi:hypothetical protein NN561_016046 [Cricetulus griseus]